MIVTIVAFSIAVYIINPTFSDQTRESPNGLSDYFETRYFEIDPRTILESLDRRNVDVFLPLTATPDAFDKLYSVPPPWKQSDYLNISNALHRFVWNEDIDDWLIESMSFYGDCRYDPLGFDLFKITYFKDIGTQQYAAHEIDLFSLYGGAAVGGGTNFPKPLFGWKSIDPERLNITAEDALRIAEDNGGKETRLSYKNECEISVLISSRRQIWMVGYYPDNTIGPIFEITINPFTGEFKIRN